MRSTSSPSMSVVAARSLVVLAAAVVMTTWVGLPGQAAACGGLFCNSRPPDPFAPLPVAQTGENVVFAIEKDPAGGATTLVAHIQILYAGDAAKFSWVVPVDAAPELSVGTDRLFSALASVTQPRFTSQSITDGQCIPPPMVTTDRGAMPSAPPSGAPGQADAGFAPNPMAPEVVVTFQGAVGPFDAAVIQSTDPMALKKWLMDNGYIVSDQAAALIDGYVRDGKYFVALKLLNGVAVRAIQPIVLTFKGTEPCVPLRLTAIAANPDMPVRMWILADRRAVPKNFLELKIDDARIDWLAGGSNYNALVTQAANEAGGNAFVTEYAGSAKIGARALWFEGQFNVAALQAAMTPPNYVQVLTAQGLANDTQTLPLLAKHIPMPAAVKAMGIADAQFYGNLSFYWSQYAFPPFDLVALTTDITDKIIEPRRIAQAMIDGHPYLTRLNTFISPEEMNVDPLFIINKDLPDVSSVHTAVFRTMCGTMQFTACNAPVRLELPDGRMAWIRSGLPGTTCTPRGYDVAWLQKLPAADVAWQREDVGEGTRKLDNTATIEAGLLLNNRAYPAEQKMFPLPSQGPGKSVTGDPARPDPVASDSGMGCACGVARAPLVGSLFGAVAAVALGAASVLRRRRRGRS
ncbi:MAG: DUF2330 domain-containing protein [Bacteroidota bacterium]